MQLLSLNSLFIEGIEYDAPSKKKTMLGIQPTLFILFFLLFNNCESNDSTQENGIDYKEEMRTFVKEISAFAKNQDPDFIVIPQNGHRLVSSTGEPNGTAVTSYLEAVDALGQEDLYYGYELDDLATPDDAIKYLEFFLDLGKAANKKIFVTDYASTQSKMTDSYLKNSVRGYVSFAADQRDLNNIPSYPTPIWSESTGSVTNIQDANNFLYLINPGAFESKVEFLTSISETNYDMIIMDAFYMGEMLTSTDLELIRTKANGGTRLLISYMSVGEAEDYRYYWDSTWEVGSPSWLVEENPNWGGNYKVSYWEDEWKQYIIGNSDSYLQKIIDVGFDGTYLDIIQGFEYFEFK